MKSQDRRLYDLEVAAMWRRAALEGAKHGVSAAQVIAGLRRGCELTREQREATMQAFFATLSPEEREQAHGFFEYYGRLLARSPHHGRRPV